MLVMGGDNDKKEEIFYNNPKQQSYNVILIFAIEKLAIYHSF
tara:strand:+ start:102 stop:227 length:126 start_codon:yes stop_codon:yes gene_type:complete